MWSVDYAYAFPQTDARPESALGFFRNSAQGPFGAISYETTSQTMSLLAVSRRAAWRAAPRSSRTVVVEAAPKDWVSKREAVKHHAIGA